MKKVLILQKVLPEYRVPFFNKLRQNLVQHGVQLDLIYGSGSKEEQLKKDKVDIDWAIKKENVIFNIASKEVYWQPVLKEIKGYDLIIAEQANKLIINYILNIKRGFSKQKFAYWGHGINLQASGSAIGNLYKKFFLKKCDWWFAYTNSVKQFLIEQGYDTNKITVVQNAIDTSTLKAQYQDVTEDEINQIKDSLGITTEQIGIFCGGMYEEKRLPFLIEACDLIKENVPDFQIIFIGAGKDEYLVKEASKQRKWMHYVGPKRGKEKATYFKLSKLFLMPGLVGLAVLDSFCTETPMITTDYPFHSPEIEYIDSGKNGLIAKNSITDFVKSVCSLLTDKNVTLQTLIKGCQDASSIYTIDKMAENFSDGILKALNKNIKTHEKHFIKN